MTFFRSPLFLGALLLVPALPLSAQPRGKPDPRFAAPEQIDEAEGARVLAAFRCARTKGDYSFAFELVNRPKGGKPVTSLGRMLGTWDDEGYALTRTEIVLEGGRVLRFVYRGGPQGWIYRAEGDAPAVKIEGTDSLKPVLDGLTFTPFDLQMPFLFWTDARYEGTKKLQDRPAHYFLLTPPAGTDCGEVKSVRVAIDADFLVMLSAEELGADGTALKEFRINGFAKVNGQWIVKEIDLVDERSKDRTRLRVDDALVGITLSPDLFHASAGEKIAPLPSLAAPATEPDAADTTPAATEEPK